MRTLLAIVSALVVMLGVASAKFWRDLRHERQINVDVIAQLNAARAMSRTPVAAAMPVVAAAPVTVATTSTPAAAPVACKPAADPRVVTVADNFPPTSNQNVAERDLLKDPEYRKARIALNRLNLQRNNPGVAEALGLNDKETDKLLDLLAENQIRMNELPAIDAGNARANAEENSRRQQALQKQQEESVAALLGASGYAQWQEYQQTRNARSQAFSMGSQLLQMGVPLSNGQLKPLTNALIAEQQRLRQEQQNIVRNGPVQDPLILAQIQEENRRRNVEANRRMLAAIAPSLNAQQLAVFREQFETQETMNQVSSRARERALAARGQQPPPPPPPPPPIPAQ